MILIFKTLTFGLFLNSFFCTKPGARILGGQEVQNRSDFPYQALIFYQNLPICGGTIIDKKHVLTAAHCVVIMDEKVQPSEMFVSVGNLLLNDISNVKEIDNFFVHENFSTVSFENDIAILSIVGTFEFNSNKIQPLNLTTEHLSSGTCNISGWGVTSDTDYLSMKLVYTEIGIVDRDSCNETYIHLSSFAIPNNVLCAGSPGRDARPGDSGGPLVCLGRLTGIISTGVNYDVGYFPGMYTEVAKYLDWIKEKAANASLAVEPLLSIILLLLLLIMTFL